jgi:hypothetical protein
MEDTQTISSNARLVMKQFLESWREEMFKLFGSYELDDYVSASFVQESSKLIEFEYRFQDGGDQAQIVATTARIRLCTNGPALKNADTLGRSYARLANAYYAAQEDHCEVAPWQ